MLKKITTIVTLGLSSAAAFAAAPQAVKVTLQNSTPDYVFYVEGTAVQPGDHTTVTLNDSDTVKLTMDSKSNPTPWKTSGLGNGGISYSVDKTGQHQSNFGLSLGPASIANVSSAAPTFTVSGQVTGSADDNFTSGFSTTLHSTSTANTISITAK